MVIVSAIVWIGILYLVLAPSASRWRPHLDTTPFPAPVGGRRIEPLPGVLQLRSPPVLLTKGTGFPVLVAGAVDGRMGKPRAASLNEW